MIIYKGLGGFYYFGCNIKSITMYKSDVIEAVLRECNQIVGDTWVEEVTKYSNTTIDLNLDGVDLVELEWRLEKALGIKLMDNVLFENKTIEEIGSFIHRIYYKELVNKELVNNE